MGLRSERAACRCCGDELTSWGPNPPTELAVGLARLTTALRRTRGGDSPPGPKAPWVPRSPPLARRGLGRRGMLPAFGCNPALLVGRIRRPCEEALACRARFGRNPCGHLGAARSNVPSSARYAVSGCRAPPCGCRRVVAAIQRCGAFRARRQRKRLPPGPLLSTDRPQTGGTDTGATLAEALPLKRPHTGDTPQFWGDASKCRKPDAD